MTTGDWDYSDMLWDLDPSTFVSAPTCWRHMGLLVLTDIFIKTAVVSNAHLIQGRNDSYARLDGNHAWTVVILMIRYQDSNNFYCVTLRGDGLVGIVRALAGVQTTLTSLAGQVTDGVWERWRVTWWNDYVGIVIRLEKFVAGDWTIILQAYDANNYWKAAGGRTGFSIRRGIVTKAARIDDTYLYGVQT